MIDEIDVGAGHSGRFLMEGRVHSPLSVPGSRLPAVPVPATPALPPQDAQAKKAITKASLEILKVPLHNDGGPRSTV